ncbi:hypothetical protein D018_0126B, partial [Vibrio parahaemolyticus VP2007-007]
SKGNES